MAVAFLSDHEASQRPPYGPLVRPGLYRSYQNVYEQLSIIPRHTPVPYPTSQFTTEDPYRIHFHVWKGNSKWKRTDPPPPDFYMTVVDAQTTDVPSFEEIDALVDATPFFPPKATWTGPRMMYPRLKHGYRHVLIAVVDHGIINYMRFLPKGVWRGPFVQTIRSNTRAARSEKEEPGEAQMAPVEGQEEAEGAEGAEEDEVAVGEAEAAVCREGRLFYPPWQSVVTARRPTRGRSPAAGRDIPSQPTRLLKTSRLQSRVRVAEAWQGPL